MAVDLNALPSVDLTELEADLDKVLAFDPALLERVHSLFLKLQKLQPAIQLVIKLAALVHK